MAEITLDGIKYTTIDDNTVKASKQNCTKHGIIPPKVKIKGKEYLVTEIETLMWYKNKPIPDSVTSILILEGCSDIIIPDSVTSIGAFVSCSNITIPNSVTSIKGFTRCSNITIPDSVTSIGGFYACSNITIPDSVTSIRRICSSTLIIPTSVKTINEVSGKDGILMLSIKRVTPPNIDKAIYLAKDDVLIVPKGAARAYDNHSLWGKFKNISEDPSLQESASISSSNNGDDDSNSGEDRNKSGVSKRKRDELQKKIAEIQYKREEFLRKREELLRKREELIEKGGVQGIVERKVIVDGVVKTDVVIIGNKYSGEYDNIKKIRPIEQVIMLADGEAKYKEEDREEWKRKERSRIEIECKEYIATVSPQTDTEVVCALDFLLNLLPSASVATLFEYNYGSDRELVHKVVLRIKKIITESEDVYSENNTVMTKIKVAKERLNAIVDVFKNNISKCEEKLANLDNEFNEKRQAHEQLLMQKARIKKMLKIFVAILVLPLFLMLFPLLGILLLLGLGVWYFKKRNRKSDENKSMKNNEFTEQDKIRAESKLKESIESSRKEIQFFEL